MNKYNNNNNNNNNNNKIVQMKNNFKYKHQNKTKK
jgi:hypothetical protein